MTVYLFSVGQGDHLLLELPNGEFGLIDFHWDYEHNPNHEPPALTFLKRRHAAGKPVVISFLCISHPDFDHVKGLCRVLDWIKTNDITLRRVWLYPGVDEEDIHRALARVTTDLKRIRSENLSSGLESPPEGVPNNSTILRVEEELECLRRFLKEWSQSPDLMQGIVHLANLAGAVEVCCLAPLAEDIRQANRQALRSMFLWAHHQKKLKLADRNRLSSIIKMSFGPHQLLFGGDAGEGTWQKSLDAFERQHESVEGPCNRSLRASFVKASHHGSVHSSSLRLWERILAKTTHVGISAGKGQNHPDERTLLDILNASRSRASTVHLFATNICSKCVIGRHLTEENWSWLRATVKTSKRDETAQALRLEAPADRDNTRNLKGDHRSLVINDALRAVAPSEPVEANRQKGALVAYILRFHSQSSEVRVSKATADLSKRGGCIFEYEGEEFFPECSNA